MVSTERIYQYIRKEKEGDLYQNLRYKLKHRKQLPLLRRGLGRGRKSISLCPEIVLTNEELGYFEVDLIVGAEHKGAILTIVERKTKLLIRT